MNRILLRKNTGFGSCANDFALIHIYFSVWEQSPGDAVFWNVTTLSQGPPKVDFLRGLGVKEDDLGSIVVRSPRLLHTPISELERKVQWLASCEIADG